VTRTLRLGTRGSKLALVQSRRVAARLGEAGHDVELVTIVTDGDTPPEGDTPGVGVFVTALEEALAGGRVDIAVHSAKDVPLECRAGLVVAAYPERADPRDVLVTARGGATLRTLPGGARVGTDSPRRAGFLLSWRPDLRVVPLHGNVDTRLRRLAGGEADALVLAAAGLVRLDALDRIDEWLEPDVVAPAPGQGALAIQCRASDRAALRLIGALDDPAVRLAVATERVSSRRPAGPAGHRSERSPRSRGAGCSCSRRPPRPTGRNAKFCAWRATPPRAARGAWRWRPAASCCARW
jgi:hydroxymethylbilane synthase